MKKRYKLIVWFLVSFVHMGVFAFTSRGGVGWSPDVPLEGVRLSYSVSTNVTANTNTVKVLHLKFKNEGPNSYILQEHKGYGSNGLRLPLHSFIRYRTTDGQGKSCWKGYDVNFYGSYSVLFAPQDVYRMDIEVPEDFASLQGIRVYFEAAKFPLKKSKYDSLATIDSLWSYFTRGHWCVKADEKSIVEFDEVEPKIREVSPLLTVKIRRIAFVSPANKKDPRFPLLQLNPQFVDFDVTATSNQTVSVYLPQGGLPVKLDYKNDEGLPTSRVVFMDAKGLQQGERIGFIDNGDGRRIWRIDLPSDLSDVERITFSVGCLPLPFDEKYQTLEELRKGFSEHQEQFVLVPSPSQVMQY